MRRKRDETNYLSSAIVDPLVIGSVLLLIGVVAVIISYNASRGLPFVPTYDISADVQDAAQLVAGSSEVRVGGARVGLVKTIEAEPATGGKPPYARLNLALNQSLEQLPSDSRIAVRPKSVFGLKYLDLKPGHSSKKVAAGGILPLKQARKVVEINDAFNLFDKQTSTGIQDVITSLGNAVAGRGGQLNQTAQSAAQLMLPLQRITRVLISPRTGLADFIRSAADASTSFAEVAPQFGDLFDKAAITLKALDAAGPALGQSLAELPSTESAATATANRAIPVLADAAAITRSIRPGTKLLPLATDRLGRVLDAATPTLRRTPRLVDNLARALAALDQLSRDRASSGAVRKLLAAVTTLRGTLAYLVPAQLQCNTLGLVLRNLGSASNEGNALGSWLDVVPIIDLSQELQASKPVDNLHYNYYPNEGYDECEAGNEPFKPGQQQIGSPAGNQSNSTADSAPPASVRALARRAGLWNSVPKLGAGR